jgi:hypothetical protein
MVLRYEGGEEAEDMHKQVIEAVVSKAENIAGANWKDAVEVSSRDSPINARTVDKFLRANMEVAGMVEKINQTIGGDLDRANRALKTIERAVAKVTKAKRENK